MKLSIEKKVIDLETQRQEIQQKLITKGLDPEENSQYQDLSLQIKKELENVYSSLKPWDIVQIARYLERPQFLDYKDMIFEEFIEIHGDKLEADDKSIIGGFASIQGKKVMIIGQQRGKTLDEALKKYNRGMPTPNGYRKAHRIMGIADKFGLPLITFIDTPGADPGIVAEEKGQGAAIAFNLEKMSELRVPVITICIGEGGSGGAIALGVGNINLMLKYAVYSVISPEGAAAILFRDSSLAASAAHSLKITSADLLKLKLVDEVIDEPIGAAHRNPQMVANNVKVAIVKYLDELSKLSETKLIDKRLEKLLQIGFFEKQ